MNRAPLLQLGRQRYIAITIGAGIVAAISAVFLVGAPPIPALAGVVLAVGWLIYRAPGRERP